MTNHPSLNILTSLGKNFKTLNSTYTISTATVSTPVGFLCHLPSDTKIPDISVPMAQLIKSHLPQLNFLM
jgi:hypothetical protein